jgi:N-dimethylarginine dimethylaminohydrolase
MCPPSFFAVDYEINPWMRVTEPVDRDRASAQWSAVKAAYERLGHVVDLIAPVPGLPDLVFTANAALVVGGRALLSRFRHAERAGEEAVFASWFAAHDIEVVPATAWNEGEDDVAGWGFRTDRRAHAEVAAFSGREVVALELVDPRWYHLDTALAVLDDDAATIAYHPGAFSPASRRVLAERFPDAVVASARDALAFGLNACSDGRHVVLAAGATGLAAQLAERGFEPLLLDTSELQKAGGSAKCMTLEVRT